MEFREQKEGGEEGDDKFHDLKKIYIHGFKN